MPSEARARRVADRISRELAVILQRETADPRLSMITVTGVEVDRELAYATVYVSTYDLEERDRATQVLGALERATGFLRSRLAKRIPMRTFPKLRFRWDASPDRGARVDELLEQLRQEEEGQE